MLEMFVQKNYERAFASMLHVGWSEADSKDMVPAKDPPQVQGNVLRWLKQSKTPAQQIEMARLKDFIARPPTKSDSTTS